MSRPETYKIPTGELAYSNLQLPRAELLVTEGPDRGKRATVDTGGTLRLGSGPENDLVLCDETVSSSHALILHKHEGFLVRDLGSTNGTWVEQIRVTEAFLGPGCALRLGRTVLSVTPKAEELVVFPSASDTFHLASGKSLRMRQVFGLLERVAPSELTILLHGETGTGKEVIARSVHLASRRAKKPWVVFDCGRTSREFIEAELFGHEKGAYTGALVERAGAFEQAHGGTLFIDEIGELTADLQPKLLRVLEERRVRRLGAAREVQVDVRVVAATHRDLPGMVREGAFREDLFYRLAVLLVKLPPLRERREDVPGLTQRILERCRGSAITPEAMAVLACQAWRGNVRELVNVVERAAAVAAGEPIRPGHLLLLDGAAPSAPGPTPGALAGLPLRDLEREAIVQTLAANGNNKAAAARTLGIATSTLFEKMKRYGLEG